MLFGCVTGRTKIRIEGAMPLSFVGEIRKSIAVRNIKSEEFACEFFVRRQKAEGVCGSAKDRGFKVSVLENSGLFCFAQKLFKRPGLVLGCAFFVLLVYISSLFVWDINVIGNEKVSDEEIRKGLSKIGLHEGVLKSSIDIGSVRNRYIISDRRISWMSVILYGTTANIEVIESEIAPPREDKAPLCNIVALRDGIIERVDALCGQGVVAKGQVVSRGELLVSAVVKTRKENELLTGAKGNVFARTQRRFEVCVPLYEYKKKYTSQIQNCYAFSVMGREFVFPSFWYKIQGEIYDCEKSTTTPVLFGKIELPFEIIKKTYREYEREKIQISEEEGKKTAEAKLSALIEREIGSAPVVNKELDFKISDGVAVLSCNIECIENIAQKVPVIFSS